MMSSITPLINYLKIFRRNDQSQKNEKYIEGSVLDENYKDDDTDLKIVIEKEKLSESLYFTELKSTIAGFTSLYIQINSEEPFYDYSIRNEITTSTGITSYQYKNIFGDSWENSSGSYIEIPIVSSADNYFYSHDSKRVVLLPLNTIFGFPDWLIYHPNAIPEITNDDYTFNYKDHEGYTNDALDFTFRLILEPVVEFINNLRKRTVDVEKSQIPGKMYLYPHITTEMNKYVLYYNFVGTDKTFFKTAQNPYAIRLEFNYLGAMLEFLNQTIFYEADSISFEEGSGSKKYFFERYKRLVNAEIQLALQKNIANVLEILYYTPKLFLKEINTNTLWDILEKAITGKSLTNIGLNEEDVVLVLLEALSEIEKTENIFLLKLIEEKQDKKSYFSLLYEKMNGQNFVKLVQFLYSVWLKSSFINFDNPYYKDDNGPLTIPYKSQKFAGFYSSNRNFDFKKGKHIEVSEDESWIDNIISAFDPNLGEYVNQIVEEQNKFSYHLFQPMMLTDIEQESPIPLPRLLPAFFLKANEDKAFWSNVITGIEYTVDAITTLSGFGNLAKFRHLQRIVKVATKYKFFDKAKKFNYLAKIRFGVSAIEISSGSLNALLKLTGLADTKFGKSLTEYLFWLELLSLGGEITAAIKGGLRKSAKEVLEHTDDLKKTAKNADELKQIDEVIEHLEETSRNFKIDNFIERGIKSGKTIGKIDKATIIRELHNVTETATEVSRALKKGKIKLEKLDDIDFFKAIKEPGESLEKIKDVLACQIKNKIYIKNNTSLDKAFGEIVHEGKHALDYVNGLFKDIKLLREETKLIVHDKVSMKSFVDKMSDDQVIELRARIVEREFQIAAKQALDFRSVEAMISFIFEKYNKVK
ncbi:hypothetical protein FIA58_007505 [Flavobacterium jejuense]|uniref:Uncharacterized protein n=1 Tax=Flavobacterium jejuense TaxID=1544455 RepID=A0ABX0INZ3_9FLAO|nr:hypothetical protein [Flavobacterium jejuense]NHN25520.1 hypothetical protein [Flavobacterium jejuense]